MKNKTDQKCKKKKYSLPEIKRYDVKDLTSDWHYGVYGDVEAAPCGSPCE